MKLNNICGNTFYIDTGIADVPFYKIDNENIIMLDSGLAGAGTKIIDDILEENNLRIRAIICTHAHIDHVGNNSHLADKYGCRIAMPYYEAFTCSSAVALKVYYGALTLTDVERHFENMICRTDVMIHPGQKSVELCGIKFGILDTPGHSPGHICIITPDNVAYLGDALISREVMKSAKMPYAYMLKQDLESKERLHELKCSKYIIAHKGIYEDIVKLIDSNIDFYKKRADKILESISHDMKFDDIFQSVVKNFEIPVKNIYKYNVIERMLRSYLEYLEEIGMICKYVSNGVLKYSRVLR